MKWIKYQIVCGKNQNEEDILINKKVGYSAENIAIAEKEAYNGYTIEEDAESFDKEPLAIELGGTHANNADDARKNLGAFAAADYDGLIVKTGNPVQANLKQGRGISVITTILPAQSGSGEPYPAGGGKNLLNPDSMIKALQIAQPGAAPAIKNGYGWRRTPGNTEPVIGKTNNLTLMKVNTTYTLSFVSWVVEVGSTISLSVDCFPDTLPETSITITSTPTRYAWTFSTADEAIENAQIRFFNINNYDVNICVVDVQLEKGSTATEYAPYVNIRPISGWTGAKLTRCGKNLCTESLVQGTRGTSGVLLKGTSYTAVTIENLIPVAPGMKLYLSTSIGALSMAYRYYLYDEKQQLISTAGGVPYNSGVTVPDGAYYFAFQYSGSNYADYIGASVMARNGVFDSYEPYTGNTYTADFGNTVYGGTLDWQTGVLTVDRAIFTLTGEDGAKMTGTSGVRPQVFGFDNSLGILKPADGSLVADALSSHFKIVSWTELTSGSMFDAFAIHANGSIGFAYNGTISEANAWLSAQYAAGTPVQVCYKLATPTTIQLTSQEMIEALDGLNTIYTDCGSNDVTFNHDLTLLNAVPKPTPESIGAAPANHTHTPESIGAAKSNHTHADFAYSEAEVNTGKTWIDGKPIYKKTIAITSTISAPAGVTMKVVGAILDIDVPIKIYGAVAYHSDNAPYTWYQLGSHVDLEDKMWTGSTIDVATGQVKLYVSNLTIGSGYVTVEYTKKTN